MMNGEQSVAVLNWREAQRTMLTEETQAAVLCMNPSMLNKRARGAQAIEALKEKNRSKHLACPVSDTH